MKRIIFLLLFSANLLSISACNGFKAWFAREFIQGTVADGLARLSVQPMAIITNEIKDQFDNPSVIPKITPSLEPKEYGKGHVSWTIGNFDIIHAQEKVVYSDCYGEQGFWRGKVHIISATRTIYGRLTGNHKHPVIPDPGSVVIEVHVEVENLSIRFPSKEGYLVMDRGVMKFKAIPRLAQGQNGMRITPTSNTKLSDIKLSKIVGTLKSSAVDMPIEIEEASLSMQVGPQDDGQENTIGGTLKIFGNTHHVPSDGKGLDPDYDAEKFLKSYSCHKDLAHGVSFDHIPIEEKLAPGVAGLTALVMGIVAAKLEDHDGCGMASVAALRQAKLKGLPGDVGTLESKLPYSCSIEFINEQTEPDCFGRAHFINGSVTVTKARKIMHGMVIASQENYRTATSEYAQLLLGDNDKQEILLARPAPIIPQDSRPVEMEIEAVFDQLSVKDLCLDSNNRGHKNHCRKQSAAEYNNQVTFNIFAGKVSAEFKPVLAKDVNPKSLTNKFCAAKTPIAEAKLSLSNMKVSIERDGMDFQLPAEGSFNIVSGKIGDRENQLIGGLEIGSTHVLFKSNDKNFLVLDPGYDRQLFYDSFLSCQQAILVDHPNQCRPEEGLAANIGRLIVLNAGSLLKISAHREIPGSLASFTGEEILNLLGTLLSSENPNNASLDANINTEKHISGPSLADLVTSSDSLNNKTTIKGYLSSLRGTMKRTGTPLSVGEQTQIFISNVVGNLPFRSNIVENLLVRPTVVQSTIITISNAQVRDFSTEFTKVGQEPEPRLEFKNGQFKIIAKPYLARHIRDTEVQPSYSIETPIISFEEIKLDNAFVQLKNQKMTVPMYIKQANIKAFNGKINGQGNVIEGNISFVINSDLSQVPLHMGPVIMIEPQALQPDYHQASFDASYRNKPNLRSVLAAD